MAEDECCLNSSCTSCMACLERNCACFKPCIELCCEEPKPSHLKTKEEIKKEQARLEILMRIGVYSGYTFAFFAFWTQHHMMWNNVFLFLLFWLLFASSLISYEKLRSSNPGYMSSDDIGDFYKKQNVMNEKNAQKIVEQIHNGIIPNGMSKRNVNTKLREEDDDVYHMSPVHVKNGARDEFELEDPFEKTVCIFCIFF